MQAAAPSQRGTVTTPVAMRGVPRVLTFVGLGRTKSGVKHSSSLFVRLSLTTVGLLALMSAIVIGVTFWTRATAVTETGALARAGELKALAFRSRALGLAQDNITKTMLLEPEMMELAAAKIDAYDESQVVLAKLDSLVPVELGPLMVALHALEAERMRPLDTKILELMASAQLAEAKRIYFAEYEPTRLKYDAMVQQLATRADSQAVIAEQRVIETSRTGFVRIVTVLSLGIIFITIWVMRAGLLAGAKLERVVSALEVVATGDLTRSLPVESSDEIGRIATALNGTVHHLRELVSDIQRTGQRLVGSSEHIATSASVSADTVQQLDKVIDQISLGASQQAESIETASAVVDDLSQTASNVLAQASALATVSAHAVTVAHRGGASVTVAIGELNGLRESVQMTGKMMDGLKKQSARIGEITQVIAGVASQTNLLALNASIEAARAGEHGRGFSVIATEVRNLSMSANKSSSEIAKLIEEIQSQVSDTAQTIEASTARLDRGAASAREAEVGLGEILGAVEQSDKQLRGIGESASFVTNGAGKVREIVLEIAAVAHENASAAQEMSAQSQQVTAAMHELAVGAPGSTSSGSSALALSAMARDLGAAVARFTV